MDDRTRRMLEALGHIDQNGIGRKAQRRNCRKCRAPVVMGVDRDVCGWTSSADPVPLDVWAELAAVMAGLRTFDLTFSHRYELDVRDEWRIKGVPAGTGRDDVLAQHRCGRFIISTATTRFTGRLSVINSDGEPPF